MLDFGDITSEAAEQAGIDPASLTHRHLTSMSRSLFLLFSEIEVAGATPEYRQQTDTYTLAAGQGVVVLPADTMDVMDVVVRTPASMPPGPVPATNDTGLTRTHRQEWLNIADKASRGMPTCYWVSKSLPAEIALAGIYGSSWGVGAWGGAGFGGGNTPGVNAPTDAKLLVLWQINDVQGRQVLVNRLRFTGLPNALGEPIDASREWLSVICSGLAAKTAKKFNFDRYQGLQGEYEAMLTSKLNDENRGPVFIGHRAFGFSRRRRH